MTPPCPPLPPACRTVVFLGPSLPAHEAAALLPDAEIRPPVRMGDLYALLTSHVETVLVIDGVFHGITPVWQREILALLAAGKRVVGAASMGALRALELGPYGMIGVGTVFEWYRDGVIEGDDEVALLHADAGLSYLPLTLPLVDIRHILDLAARDGALTTVQAAALARGMKSLGYSERTASALLQFATDLGIESAALNPLLGSRRASLKAADARLALRLVAGSAALEAPAVRDLPVLRLGRETALLRAGYAPDGRALRVVDALAASTADTAATARRLREASRRRLLADWAGATGLGPDARARDAFADAWIDARASDLGLTPGAWLAASALARGELPDLLRGHAVEAWLATRSAAGIGLAAAPAGCPLVPLVIVDWARRSGISPPPHLPEDPEAVAAWIVQSGPAHFGDPDWEADVAVARTLQLEGVLAAMLVQRPPETLPTDARVHAGAG